VPTSGAICEVKTEYSGLKPYRRHMNLSDRADISCEMLTSLLIRQFQMGEMSELGRLVELVKHAIWADSLYFLYLLLLSVSQIPAYHMILFMGMLG
jgi:hypothetical protein